MKIDKFSFREGLFGVIIIVILGFVVFFPESLFADTMVLENTLNPNVITFEDSTYTFALPKLHEASSLYPIMQALPNPLGMLTQEYLQDKRIDSYFVHLKDINYTKLAGGMWLRFSLKGSEIKKKKFLLNVGSYVAMPISVFVSKETDSQNSFRKIGDFSTNRVYLGTENAEDNTLYTYYIGIQNIPSPLFIPLLENISVESIENVTIFKLLIMSIIGILILVALLRIIVQKAYPFLCLIVYKVAILLSISLGIIKTPEGFIDLVSLPMLFVFQILMIVYPFLGKVILFNKENVLPKKYHTVFFLFACIGMIFGLLPQVPTMAWLARYIVLWPMAFILWLPFIFVLVKEKYTNALLYFLSGFIPSICVVISLFFNVNEVASFIYIESFILAGAGLSSLLLSLVSIPKQQVRARSSTSSSNLGNTSMPYWMQEVPDNTLQDLSSEDNFNDNSLQDISDEDYVIGEEDDIIYFEDKELSEVQEEVAEELEEIIQQVPHNSFVESKPEVIKERIVEAMKREPNIMRYSPRELFIYLYRALKPYSEAYNVDLSWFVDPGLQEDQEHDSDVIYSTLYSIGESLIVNNPNSNMHIGAKKITDDHLPSHVRFSIMIMPEETLHNFKSASIASIAELIAIAGGTLFMGNAQGKKMEMIITLPAMAKVFVGDEKSQVPAKLAPFINVVPEEKDINLVSFASSMKVNEEFEENRDLPHEKVLVPEEFLDEIDSINLEGLGVKRPEYNNIEEGEEIEELKREIQEILAESIVEEDELIEESSPVARFTEEELREEIDNVSEINEEKLPTQEDEIIPIGFDEKESINDDNNSQRSNIAPDSFEERRGENVSEPVENISGIKKDTFEEEMPLLVEKVILQEENKEEESSLDEEEISNEPPFEPILEDDFFKEGDTKDYLNLSHNNVQEESSDIVTLENTQIDKEVEPLHKNVLELGIEDNVKEEDEENSVEIENPVVPATIILPSFENEEKSLEYVPKIPSTKEKEDAIRRIEVQDAKVAHTPAYMKERGFIDPQEESFTESIRSSMQEIIDIHNNTQYQDIVPVFSEIPSIIIVNSDKNDRRLTAYFLEGLAYTISEVDTIEALLDYHRRYPAHLVIIDTSDIEDTLRDVIYDLHEIDRAYKSAPVLVLSIARSMHFISTLEKAGSVATISKPVNRIALRELVVQLLPEVKQLAAKTSEQWDQKDAFEPKDFSSAEIGITDSILLAKPSAMNADTVSIDEMLGDSINSLSSTFSTRKSVEEETHSILEIHVESIPYFLNALQSLMAEAEQAMRLRNCYKIAEIATKLAKENGNFGLKSMEKVSLCIRRAAEAMDMEAVENLFNELAMDMEKVITILARKYEERK
ncbi:MAG: hypothetical protein ACRCV3_00895 [Desulfovibrionaceae bacterium]